MLVPSGDGSRDLADKIIVICDYATVRLACLYEAAPKRLRC